MVLIDSFQELLADKMEELSLDDLERLAASLRPSTL